MGRGRCGDWEVRPSHLELLLEPRRPTEVLPELREFELHPDQTSETLGTPLSLLLFVLLTLLVSSLPCLFVPGPCPLVPRSRSSVPVLPGGVRVRWLSLRGLRSGTWSRFSVGFLFFG